MPVRLIPPPRLDGRRARRGLTTLVVFLSLSATALAARPPAVPAGEDPVDYNRQVRPILSNNCYQCHGPDADERQADLRLDLRDEALAPAESGRPAIVPGKPDESPLVKRVFSTKKGQVMPPPKTHKSLSAEEKDLLRRWVAQGAPYQTHWSFLPPKRPSLPAVRNEAWVRNPVDRFILARLESEGLSPSPEADRATLIRRLSLDLTGLPPTPEEVDRFLADRAGDAYERLVDRLLASPHYGERMALDWLDAARYADTHGFHIDSGRDMTRWREWVIDAFNANLPFDEFTIDQLAGDLLPNATLAQKIASGFNRNHMINFEGGAIPEEYHNVYVIDRVNTTGTVWLGLTVACSQCHDHKYDPITQRDFYSLYAFFNNVPEKGLDGSKGNAAPLLRLPSPGQQSEIDRLSREVAGLTSALSRTSEADRPKIKAKLDDANRRLSRAEAAVPSTMVMAEMPEPRETFLLVRGQYDKRGEKVTPGVPSFLPPLPDGVKPDRLALARWLVDPRHPLVGRVTVNRLWQAFFGEGLVRTVEDFGSQGELPSHPKLLDWLAVEFITPEAGGRGWDVKAFVRMIVTSASYRQRSSAVPELIARDPENRLLARGARVRLPAEFLRVQALDV
jgi:hypothetical protein